MVVKEDDVVVGVDDIKVCILLYVDNIVVIAENEPQLHKLLNIIYGWCNKLR